uniref:Eukaryotic translation initiation factor 3 subunit G N-terminal domain-containing protein n=1 Tax=Chenopodium quinoa TaxID=63459 RepID=A0A803N278_CHEQI
MAQKDDAHASVVEEGNTSKKASRTTLLEEKMVSMVQAISEHRDSINDLNKQYDDVEARVKGLESGTEEAKVETQSLVSQVAGDIRAEMAQLKDLLMSTIDSVEKRIDSMEEKIESLHADVVLCKLAMAGEPKKERSNKSSGNKGKGGGAKPTERSHNGSKSSERKDKEKEKSHSDRKSKRLDCFLCGGDHWARECPQRRKLNAIMATSPGESSGDEAHMGTLRLCNSVKATVEEPKEDKDLAKVCTLPRDKKPYLMFVEAIVGGKASKALVDTGATHNFVTLKEATRLGLKFTKKRGSLKTVNTIPAPIHGVARGVPLQLSEWKGAVDFTVVDMDDFNLVLGLEFMDSVRPFTFEEDGSLTIKRGQGAWSVPVAREEAEAKMLSSIQLDKGIKRKQATFLETMVEEKPEVQQEIPVEVSRSEVPEVWEPTERRECLALSNVINADIDEFWEYCGKSPHLIASSISPVCRSSLILQLHLQQHAVQLSENSIISLPCKRLRLLVTETHW